MTTLQYVAALRYVNDPSNWNETNPILIEMVCGILHLPIPGEHGFPKVDTPTIGNVAYMLEDVPTPSDNISLSEYWALQGNERLVVYYLTDTQDENLVERCMYNLTSTGNIEGVRILSSETGAPLTYKLIYYVYNPETWLDTDSIPVDDLLWLVDLVTITKCEGEKANALYLILGRSHNYTVLSAVLSKLFDAGCGDYIRESLEESPLKLSDNTITSETIELLQTYGVDPMPKEGDYIRESVLNTYTRVTDSDMRMYHFLTDVIGLKPTEDVLMYASGNIKLVEQLIQGGIKPELHMVVHALDHHQYEAADILLRHVSNHFIDPSVLLPLNREQLHIFVVEYWHPTVDDAMRMLRWIEVRRPYFRVPDYLIRRIMFSLPQDLLERVLESDDFVIKWVKTIL